MGLCTEVYLYYIVGTCGHGHVLGCDCELKHLGVNLSFSAAVAGNMAVLLQIGTRKESVEILIPISSHRPKSDPAQRRPG